MASNKIPIDQSIVEVFSSDSIGFIRIQNNSQLMPDVEDELQKCRRNALRFEQKGFVALIFGLMCIALDIFLTVTLHEATLPINHICPAFWLGICLVGCGLASLAMAYRDPEEMKLNYTSVSTKRARIGYYFFGISALFLFSVISTTHIVLLSLHRPSLVDKRMTFLRMLYLSGFCLLAGIWLIYTQWSAKRRMKRGAANRLGLLCKDDSFSLAEPVKEVFL